ncbi:MAG: hypothetical protein A4E66_02733 [Syntrophus sp. PtaB.Bin001]|nr:MAG: hypothetical protein A4E66_02733 [Syntrophus sp. PtaB.Bin001]
MREYADSIFYTFFKFVAELVDRICKADRVVIEENLIDEQCIKSGDRRRIGRTEFGKPFHGLSFRIDGFDPLFKRFRGYLLAAHFFQLFSELAIFLLQ